jgi:flagellar biosynthetic protein FliR
MVSMGWLVTGGLVAARLGGAMMVMPAIGIQGVPGLVRVLCALALTGVVAPIVPQNTELLTVTQLVAGMSAEVILGIVLGGALRLIFGAMALAARIMSMQMGHGAAMFFDPVSQATIGPLGALASFLALAVFLGLDLHLEFLYAMSQSFFVVPPGEVVAPLNAGRIWIRVSAMVIEAGFRLAAPVLCLTFLINTFVAVITKLSPSMNVFFALGMILTVIGGHLVLFVSMPQLIAQHVALMRSVMDLIPEILRMAGG